MTSIKRTQPRHLALDVLRGLTVTLMIIVNTSGDESHTYWPLLHALWHGFTPTDWVFPTFLFVVGNALSFALPKYAARGDAAVWAKVGRRSLTIFALGFLLYWFPFYKPNAAGEWAWAPLAATRIPGVLQRIALCFGLAALILHYGKTRGALIFCALALLGYWAALAYFGDYSMAGNAGLKLDLWLLGERHLYHGEGIAFDPEGLLGTLPATVNVIAGYFAGRLIQAGGAVPVPAAIGKLALAGVVCVALGLCWNSVLPINKKLWTSSYVLLTVGLDLLVLALLMYVIELRKMRRWTYFFEVFGKNPLFIYLLSEIAVVIMFTVKVNGQAAYSWIYATVFQRWAGPNESSLLFALSFMLGCWMVAYLMDRARIYVKV